MKIAISTSGGDAPGLNAVIRAATTAAIRGGHEVYGILNGFDSLLAEDRLVPLDAERVRGIERTGGTILGAASGGDPFGDDISATALKARLERHGIDALVMAGGDGTMGIAHVLAEAGLRVVGVPKTIDRDVVGTWMTFGFDSAVNAAAGAIDALHSTAASHNRLMVVEVMGRDTGWIALYAGIAGGAHMIALPELPYRVEAFAAHIREREARGERYHILVCAEGARAAGEDAHVSERTGRYGGVAEALAAELQERTGKDARSLSLGHLLRGGSPTVNDRVLSLQFGAAAVGAIQRGESDVMIAFSPPKFVTVPLADVADRTQRVTPDAHEVETAESLGITFGV